MVNKQLFQNVQAILMLYHYSFNIDKVFDFLNQFCYLAVLEEIRKYLRKNL
jgi:hypothetical protein